MDDRQSGESVREFRFEGVGLVVVVGAVLLTLAGAFWGGRWYERRQGPPQAAGGPLDAGPLTHVVEPQEAVDLDASADYFDGETGGQREPEAQRQVRETPPPPPVEQAPAAQPDAVASGGNYYVQVFAGRDRVSAERLVGRLKKGGFAVRLFTENPGADPLFKVRVGGFDTKDGAREAARQLKGQGHDGAFVTEVDG